jgi:hypothetical protein
MRPSFRGIASEHADQFEDRDGEQQGGSESGGHDRREGTEKGYWESGTGPSQDEQEEITES